ncbi:hypothetical protein QE152_g3722 [Popillia japonica]|uniref:PiggyBac transposable element-derived protein domain-containing protein n=1 Tax=Popillia japonica TaxID=7064 RepID=A0AAW1N3I4_POPJA
MDAGAGPSKAVKYGDPDFEQIVTAWYNGMDSDVDDCDEDFCAETVEDSSDDSENEEIHKIVTGQMTEQDEKQADDECERIQSYYYGKNRFNWSANPSKPKATHTESHSIVVQLLGLKGPAKFRNKADPNTIWNLLITENILTIILTWTNVKLDKMRSNYKNLDKTAIFFIICTVIIHKWTDYLLLKFWQNS